MKYYYIALFHIARNTQAQQPFWIDWRAIDISPADYLISISKGKGPYADPIIINQMEISRDQYESVIENVELI
jgi:hypothetical protein